MINLSKTFRIISFKSLISKERLPLFRFNAQNRFYSIFVTQPSFQFCSSSNLIKNLDEIRKAQDLTTKKKFSQSIEFYARSFEIIPLFIKGDDEYNKELNQIISGFVRSCLYLQKYQKINDLFQKVKSSHSQEYEKIVDKENLRVFSILNYEPKEQNEITFLEKILNASSIIQSQANPKLYQDLLKKADKTESELLPNNLLGLMNEDIKLTFVFIINQLLINLKFRENVNYNKFCNKLLERCEKTDKSNLIKALTVISINLIAKDQYLQAEGMLNYCISLKKQTFSQEVLQNNQQFILCNLLLSELFRKVQRENEADRIEEEYKGKLVYRSLKIQSLCLNSIE